MNRQYATVASAVVVMSRLWALPTGAEPVAGQVNFVEASNMLDVHAQGKAIIQWEQFNIASQEAVRFHQADSSRSAILNRVIGGKASDILGSLFSNCPIYLINSKGVFIGSSAVIDTAGFIASTADLEDAQFLSDQLDQFQQLGEGAVVNCGKIVCSQGDVRLIARKIDNQGSIVAPKGVVQGVTTELMLYPGEKQAFFVRLSEGEEGIAHSGTIEAAAVDLQTRSPYEAAIRVTGDIRSEKIRLIAKEGRSVVEGNLQAESGQVWVLGKEVHIAESAKIDVSGDQPGEVLIGGSFQGKDPAILSAEYTWVDPAAQIVADGGGKVVVWGDHQVGFFGSISARGSESGGDGGFVEVSARSNGLIFKGKVDTFAPFGTTGTLLLDPIDITINNVGPTAPLPFPTAGNLYDPPSNAVILASDILTHLTSNQLVISSSGGAGGLGDITVVAGVNLNWATAFQLTLQAARHLIFSGNANLTGGATLDLSTASGIHVLGTVVSDGPISLTASGIFSGFDGILIENGGSITTNGAGALTVVATNALTVQNNSVLEALGTGGISVQADGVNVLGGVSGSARISSALSDINIVSTDVVNLVGGGVVNSFARISVDGTTNALNAFGAGFNLLGGSASGTFAEIRSGGGRITLNAESLVNTGPLLLQAGTATGARAQIIVDGAISLPFNPRIVIGDVFPFTDVTMLGGQFSGAWSRITSPVGGGIQAAISGDWLIKSENTMSFNPFDPIGVYLGNGTDGTGSLGNIDLSAENFELVGMGTFGIPTYYPWWGAVQIRTEKPGGNVLLNASDSIWMHMNDEIRTGEVSISSFDQSVNVLAGGDMLMEGGYSPLFQAVYVKGRDINCKLGGDLTLRGANQRANTYIYSYEKTSIQSNNCTVISGGEGNGAGFYNDGTLDVNTLGDVWLYNNIRNYAAAFIYGGDVTINAGGDFKMTSGAGEFHITEVDCNDLSITASNVLTRGGSYLTGEGWSSVYAENIVVNCTGDISMEAGTGLGAYCEWIGNSVEMRSGGDFRMIGGNSGGLFFGSWAWSVLYSNTTTEISARNIQLTAGNAKKYGEAYVEIWAHDSIDLHATQDIILTGNGRADPVNGYGWVDVYGWNTPCEITLTGRNLSIAGGGNQYGYAGIHTYGSGPIRATMTGTVSLVGGDDLGDNYADIATFGSGDIRLTAAHYLLQGGSSAGNVQAYITPAAGYPLRLFGGSATLQGGTGVSSDAYCSTTNAALVFQGTGNVIIQSGTGAGASLYTTSGNIRLNTLGDVQVMGGDFPALIEARTSGRIGMQADNLHVLGGISGDAGIRTDAGNIHIALTGNCVYDSASAPAVLQTFGSNITVIAGNDIELMGNTDWSVPLTGGHLLAIADHSIFIRANAVVHANSATNAGSLTFVVDNAYPSFPGMGSGQFIIEPGAQVFTGGLGAPLRIYTATVGQNAIGAPINGAAFVPGIEFTNSNTQQWGIYYDGGSYGGSLFKFYYKNIPVLDAFYKGVMANLVQLAALLPVLKAPRAPYYLPSYHFALCVEVGDDEECAPTFSPYGSFIFEDDVYHVE